MTKRLLMVLAMVALAVWPATARQALTDPEVLFQAALHKEQVELQLDGAIAGYTDVVARSGSNTALAAKALLRMAACYERLGRPEAKATYERIVREYGASGAPADSARAKLAAIAQADGEAVAAKVWGAATDPRELGQIDAVSRDGGFVSIMDDHNDIGIRELASGRIRMLTTKGGHTESWGGTSTPSPNGRYVAYDWWDSDSQEWELRVIDRNGGAPRTLTREASDGWIVPVGWTPDSASVLAFGRRADYLLNQVSRAREVARSDIAAQREGRYMFISVADASVRMVKDLGATAQDVRLSPDGRLLALSRQTAAGKRERDLYCVALETGREVRLTTHAADDYVLDWMPGSRDGQLLFASDRDGSFGIWTMRVVNCEARGRAVRVKADTGMVRAHGFTKQGDFYYGLLAGQRNVYLATLGEDGQIAGALAPLEGRYTSGMMAAEWSPTGDKLAYIQHRYPESALGPRGTPENQDRQLAIQTMAAGEVRLVAMQPREGSPMWSADGRQIILTNRRTDASQELVGIDVETLARSVVSDPGPASADRVAQDIALSADGRRVFAVVRQPGTGARISTTIVARDLASGTEQVLAADLPGVGVSWAVSPDRRWIAVMRSGPELVVVPTGGGPAIPLSQEIAGSDHGPLLAWTADSRSVFIERIQRNKPLELWRVPLDGGPPQRTGITSPRQFGGVSAHPDGRRLAVSVSGNVRETWVLKKIPVLR